MSKACGKVRISYTGLSWSIRVRLRTQRPGCGGECCSVRCKHLKLSENSARESSRQFHGNSAANFHVTFTAKRQGPRGTPLRGTAQEHAQVRAWYFLTAWQSLCVLVSGGDTEQHSGRESGAPTHAKELDDGVFIIHI
jgi:hypothetical protein